jgi:hypothetical protein
VTSQKTAFFIVTAVKTTNLAYKIMGSYTSDHYPSNYNHLQDVLDRAVRRPSAVPTYIESIYAFSISYNTVMVVSYREAQETAPPGTTRLVNMQLLKPAIPGNPNITSVEQIDFAITVFTSTIISK